MMLRLLRFFLLLYVAVILQTVLAGRLEVLGVRPDFPFLLVLIVALHEGAAGGALCGFFAGLFVDANSAHAFGVSSLTNSIVGFLAGSLADRLVRESLLTRAIVALVATCLRDQMLVLMLQPWGFVNFFAMLVKSSLPGALYTAILSPLVMALSEWGIRWDKEPSRAIL